MSIGDSLQVQDSSRLTAELEQLLAAVYAA